MRTLVLIVLGVTLLQLVTSSPVGPFSDITVQVYRSQHRPQANSIKGNAGDLPPPPPPPALNVRKGEYVCGDRVCKLRPGQVPKGCNGVCQYPL